jgi:hypothetical protein
MYWSSICTSGAGACIHARDAPPSYVGILMK